MNLHLAYFSKIVKVESGDNDMEQRKRSKLCSNCYGQVDVDVIVCPYCGRAFDENNYECRN